jgi:SAM-dependent methyltransferase
MTAVSSSSDRAVSFSTLSPSILEKEDRLRVGRQILAVLEDHLRTTGLGARRVLDVGCSSGIITSLLADVSGPTIGVDIDLSALRLAHEAPKKENLDFRAMSGSTLDFPSESFDVVVCNQVYYWLENPRALMDEIFRVLVPGGVCFFASVNKYKLWEAQYRLPLLSMLPGRLADLYVRAAGKGERFGCRYLSFWELGALCDRFLVHRYTARILRDPERYKFTKLSTLKTLTTALPVSWSEWLEPISPNFVWVLEKSRGVSDRLPHPTSAWNETTR